MTDSLADEACEPCRAGAPALSAGEVDALLPRVPAWNVVDRDGVPRLERVFPFDDFAGTLAFTNRIGALAEAQGHHPALLTEWGRLTVGWWTHSIRGLHRTDFVMAARTDRLFSEDVEGEGSD